MVRNFNLTIAVAGTAQALAATRTPASWVVIQAAKGNTGSVYVGGSLSSPTNGTTTTNTIELAKGDSLSFPAMGVTEPYDLATILVNTDTNNDKVRVIYGRA